MILDNLLDKGCGFIEIDHSLKPASEDILSQIEDILVGRMLCSHRAALALGPKVIKGRESRVAGDCSP